MAIILPGGFNITNNEAVDARFSLESESARFSLSPANVYEGLIVYQRDTNVLWILTDTSNVSNSSGWEQILFSNIGAFQVFPTFSDLTDISVNYFSNGQIVYIVDTNTLYQADIVYADMVTTFTDTITWNEFNFAMGDSSVNAGSGITKEVSSGVTTLSLDTGSVHFQEGVEYVISSGSYIIDSGLI